MPYKVRFIRSGESYYASKSKTDAIAVATAWNRKAEDHVGVVYRGRYLKIV